MQLTGHLTEPQGLSGGVVSSIGSFEHSQRAQGCQTFIPDHLSAAAYDVTRRETFDSITDIWMKEVDMYSTVDGAVKAIIGNKLDLVSQ